LESNIDGFHGVKKLLKKEEEEKNYGGKRRKGHSNEGPKEMLFGEF
jgi:hypothetical protein